MSTRRVSVRRRRIEPNDVVPADNRTSTESADTAEDDITFLEALFQTSTHDVADRVGDMATSAQTALILAKARRRSHKRSIAKVAAGVAAAAVAFVGVTTVTDNDHTMVSSVDPAEIATSLPPIGTWKELPPLPTDGRDKLSTGVLDDGRVVLWGGQLTTVTANLSIAQADGVIFDPVSLETETIPAAPIDTEGKEYAVRPTTKLRGDRFAVSARPIDNQPQVAVYDVGDKTWMTPAARAFLDPIDGWSAADPNRESWSSWAFDGDQVTVVTRRQAARSADPLVGAVPQYQLVPVIWDLATNKVSAGAPAPLAARMLAGEAANGDGSRIAIWGGRELEDPNDDDRGGLDLFDDGAIYSPQQDTWQMLPSLGLPAAGNPTAAWVGADELVIGGGQSNVDGAQVESDSGLRGELIGVGPVVALGQHKRIDLRTGVTVAVPYPPGVDHGNMVKLEGTEGALQPVLTAFQGGPQPMPTFANGRWTIAPLNHVQPTAMGLLATSDTRDNGLNDNFEAYLYRPLDGWQAVAAAQFTNRMNAAVIDSGNHVIVAGGLEGRDLNRAKRSWLLTLPPELATDEG